MKLCLPVKEPSHFSLKIGIFGTAVVLQER